MSNQLPPDQNLTATYPQYTNLKLREGIFDQIMAACDFHIESQWNEERIRGTEYGKVYLGMLESAMQNSTQYLLGTMLIDEQKAQSAAETALTLKQQEKIDGELALIALQEEELRFKIEQLYPLEKQKLELEVQKTNQEMLLIESQVRKSNYEVDFLLPKQLDKMDAEIDKLRAEIDYLQAQEAMMIKQAQKIDKEIEYLTAKIATEWANTQGSPGGLIGKQMSLLTAQKYGFAGDIQVKVAKMYADYDAVYQGVQENPGDATVGGGASNAAGSAMTTAGAISGA